jgi:hypothetical protein
MKKYSTFLFFSLLLLAFVSCKEEDEIDPLMQIREIAYIGLSANERATLTTDWRVASVTNLQNGNYYVLFNTDDPILGPIGVIIDQDTLEIIGFAPRF